MRVSTLCITSGGYEGLIPPPWPRYFSCLSIVVHFLIFNRSGSPHNACISLMIIIYYTQILDMIIYYTQILDALYLYSQCAGCHPAPTFKLFMEVNGHAP